MRWPPESQRPARAHGAGISTAVRRASGDAGGDPAATRIHCCRARSVPRADAGWIGWLTGAYLPRATSTTGPAALLAASALAIVCNTCAEGTGGGEGSSLFGARLKGRVDFRRRLAAPWRSPPANHNGVWLWRNRSDCGERRGARCRRVRNRVIPDRPSPSNPIGARPASAAATRVSRSSFRRFARPRTFRHWRPASMPRFQQRSPNGS